MKATYFKIFNSFWPNRFDTRILKKMKVSIIFNQMWPVAYKELIWKRSLIGGGETGSMYLQS